MVELGPPIKTNFKIAGNIATGVANGMNTLMPDSVLVISGHALGRAAALQAKHSAMPSKNSRAFGAGVKTDDRAAPLVRKQILHLLTQTVLGKVCITPAVVW